VCWCTAHCVPLCQKPTQTNSDPVHWAMSVGTQKNRNLISSQYISNQYNDQNCSPVFSEIMNENIVCFP